MLLEVVVLVVLELVVLELVASEVVPPDGLMTVLVQAAAATTTERASAFRMAPTLREAVAAGKRPGDVEPAV